MVFEAAAGRLMGRGDRGIGMGRAEEGAGWDPVIIACDPGGRALGCPAVSES